MEISTAVYVIWIFVLAVAYLCVPVLLIVLTRILKAAIKIDAYARETRKASSGIRADVKHAGALVETNELLSAAHHVADGIASEAVELVGLLMRRAEGKK
jgi:hypothetical protein